MKKKFSWMMKLVIYTNLYLFLQLLKDKCANLEVRLLKIDVPDLRLPSIFFTDFTD